MKIVLDVIVSLQERVTGCQVTDEGKRRACALSLPSSVT
jgi:hypothetical protein